MRLIPQAFLLGFSAWLMLTSLTGIANARVKMPKIEELVDSADMADMIVIGEVESVRATPPAFWRQIGTTILLIASAVVLAFLFWRKKFAIAACFVVACLLVVLLFDVPFGTYQKVAQVSVLSTIKGSPSPCNISVYYDDGFVCDLHFRRSEGEGKQGFKEHVKFAIVWGARQSGQELFLQHFAGNRATAVGVRGTTVGVVPGTRSAIGQRGLILVPAA